MLHFILENSVTAIACLITAFVIQRIYHKEKQRKDPMRTVDGIKWFGLAIWAWGIGALVNLVLIYGLRMQITDKIVIYFGVLFSLVNSLFILLSLPSIEHYKRRNIIVRMVERFSEREFSIFFGGILMMITFVFIMASYNNQAISNSFIWGIDIPISVVVAFSLLNELKEAFINRKMKFMYLPCFALFLLIIVAVTLRIIPQNQIDQIVSPEFWALVRVTTALSYKILFILLFSILLYSWKFLSEKELKESTIGKLEGEKKKLVKEIRQLRIANESHLSTIDMLQKKRREAIEKVRDLEKATRIVLSDRQKEVLGNLGVCGSDKSYTEIAEAMRISVDGFQAHIYQIKKILNISGAGGKEQLIAFAVEHNLLEHATISLKSDE
ncbi:hypothetical protein [Aquimarina sp. TRL1]|uniref:hypothetical protein n=1 Tax=Aquimarina sp. (strain TRL1) TaxID=2736252 RepID=UPI0020CB1C3E|nr:hypothetical protein [Aquimarina sp. TRL1]